MRLSRCATSNLAWQARSFARKYYNRAGVSGIDKHTSLTHRAIFLMAVKKFIFDAHS